MAKKLVLLLFVLCLVPSFALADDYRDYYEIFVASFYDSNGDGIGDLNGVREKIPMLQDLGVTGVWLMPICPSPSYHKYDVTDYYAVDPDYGTIEDFEALAAALKEADIALVLDLVINHTSNLHPWFTSSDTKDYYHFTDTGYEAVFGDHMPDLNLSNERVVQEFIRIAAFWLEKGATGFRLDAVTHYEESNITFNNSIISRLVQAFPDTYFVAEVWSDAITIKAYYDSGIQSIFNYPFATQNGSIFKALQSGNGANLAKKMEAWQGEIGSAIDAPFLSNHDNGRSAGYVVRDLQKEKLAAAVYLFMPGNPFIYYGEELGMTGSGSDENKRQPYVWSVTDPTGIPNPPKGCDQTQSLLEGYIEQQENPDSLLNTYRALLAAKKRHPEIARGQVTALDLENNALCAYVSACPGSSVIIVHNFSREAVTFILDGQSYALEAYGSMLLSDSACEVF